MSRSAASSPARAGSWTVPAALLTVFMPMLAAGVIGAMVETSGPGGTELSGPDIFQHNLRLGLVMAVSGWLTFGLASVGLAIFGSLSTGYVLGAHVGTEGLMPTLAQIPHFIPETLAFSAFTAAGLYGAVSSIGVVRGDALLRAAGRSVIPSAVCAAVGAQLIAVAGVLEATVI